MLAVPFLLWATLFLALLDARWRARLAAVAAFTVVATLVPAITELLSLAHAITPLWVSVAWVAVLAVAAFTLRSRLAGGVQRLRGIAHYRPKLPDILTALVLGGFAAATLATGLLYPVTNSDSLAYHMPRVLFWYQNHSVGFFPTVDPRQLFASPLTSYFVLNFKALLFGSDRIAALPQWLAYLFSAITAALIAERLGASRVGQQAAAVVVVTVPMLALQASTPQSDLMCALWCLVGILAVLGPADTESRPQTPGVWALWAGVAAGLAVQAKPTAYLVMVPFALWFAVTAVRRRGVRQGAVLVATALLCLLAVNSAWFARNALMLNGDVLALHAPGNAGILIKAHDPASMTTNLLKNGSLLFGTPSAGVNGAMEGVVRRIVGLYSGNMQDPRTQLSGVEPYGIPPAINSNDIAPAPSSMGLLLLAVIVLLATPGARKNHTLGIYAACAAAAFLMCAALFAYSVSVARLLVVPLAVALPLVGPAVCAVGEKRRLWKVALWSLALTLGVATAGVAVAWNATSPLAPWPAFLHSRSSASKSQFWNTPYRELVFRTEPTLRRPDEEIAAVAKTRGIERIGIVQYPTDGPYMVFTYPLMSLMPDRQFGYLEYLVMPKAKKLVPFSPQAILEIVPVDDFPAVLKDGRPRGAQLMPSRETSQGVMVFHLAP